MIAARKTIALLFATFAALVPAAPAAAEFGPIQLVSKGAGQPADKASAPALSADGRYLAFEGSLGGFEGVFRKDLGSGAIVRIAGASPYDPQIQTLRATAPSISADGRYVSFTTRAQLDPGNDLHPTSADVYVADLATVPPSYELASALDGCDPETETGCGLTYGGGGLGSEASGRVALSADGRRIAFVINAESDLTSGPTGSTPAVPTPPRQVVLRDLAADTTTLVSAERDPGTGAMTEKPVSGGALVATVQSTPLRGAALSADGTTVAWLGAHLPAQVPLSPTEAERIEEVDAGPQPYDEPLWRRMADGLDAPIRRMIAGDGAADPFPDLTHKDVTSINAFQGWLGLGNVNGVPRLSADGRTAALIGNPTEAANVFLVDMSPGLSRAAAVRPLTREIVVDPTNPIGTINLAPYVPFTGHIFDLALSVDGQRVAFATARQRFPLAPPNLIGAPPVTTGLVELYLVDRESEALQRLTHGLGGPDEPSVDPALPGFPEAAAMQGVGASAPSFGGAGLVAFSSTASNLVAGDSNEASDAFLIEGQVEPRLPAVAAISPGPGPRRQRPRWRLTLSAFSLPDGAVRIVAGVPAAGRLRAKVGAELSGTLRARRLGVAQARAQKAGRVGIELELPPRLRRLARTREGVYAMVQVSFRHRGRKPLQGKIQVRFHAHPRKRGPGR
ncbi:MAG TPA: hypothetical protein VFI03_11055 [Solirubrobacterales bacterium]|nr:hypothetical protein [Solirubrobacterales bacterium]